jgi:hypothetical protein
VEVIEIELLRHTQLLVEEQLRLHNQFVRVSAYAKKENGKKTKKIWSVNETTHLRNAF